MKREMTSGPMLGLFSIAACAILLSAGVPGVAAPQSDAKAQQKDDGRKVRTSPAPGRKRADGQAAASRTVFGVPAVKPGETVVVERGAKADSGTAAPPERRSDPRGWTVPALQRATDTRRQDGGDGQLDPRAQAQILATLQGSIRLCPAQGSTYHIVQRDARAGTLISPLLTGMVPATVQTTGGQASIEIESISYQWSQLRQYDDVNAASLPDAPRPMTVGPWMQPKNPCDISVDLLPLPEIPAEVAEGGKGANLSAIDENSKKAAKAAESTPPVDPHLAPSIPALPQNPKPGFTLDCTKLYCGRDIIFIHGLDMTPVGENGLPYLSRPGWRGPNSFAVNEFMGGGFWYTHAQQLLTYHLATMAGLGARNRFVIAPWALTDRAGASVQAISYVVSRAMQEGTGVSWLGGGAPPSTAGFCVPSCVIVSSSTGAMLGNIMLGLGEAAKTNPQIRESYGDLWHITDRIKTQISVQGAFGGSDLASILYAVIDREATVTHKPVSADHSIAVDLTPSVASSLWYPVMNRNVTTPILEVASASPDGLAQITAFQNHPVAHAVVSSLLGPASIAQLLKLLTPGPDDSVLPATSGCGNQIIAQQRPSGMLVAPVDLPKVFDRGAPVPSRAINLLWSQLFNKRGGGLPQANYVAASCSSYLTPTGMLLPPAIPTPAPYSPERYLGAGLGQHCPVILTSSRHTTEIGGAGDPDDPEEVFVLPPACAFLYGNVNNINAPDDHLRLLDPAIAGQVGMSTYEFVIGPVDAALKVRIFGRTYHITVRLFPEIVVWRRHYFRLNGWSNETSIRNYVPAYFAR